MITPALIVALSFLGAPAPAASAALPAAETARAEPNYTSIIADRAPAMATVKFVVSFDAGGQSQEIEGEAMALMIDPKGLLVMSGVEIGQRRGMSATPKDIKVLLGEDTEGVPAKLIGRDSELDLAWLRIEKPSDKGYSAVDPAKNAKVAVGDTMVGLDKMSKYFDHASVAFPITVGGVTKKPRELIIPAAAIGWVGLPVFNGSGAFVGMSVIQMPNADSEGDMRSRGERLTPFDRGFKILPAAEIAAATGRAVEAEKSGKGVGMEEPKKEDEKKDDAKPEGDKKPEAPKTEPTKKD